MNRYLDFMEWVFFFVAVMALFGMAACYNLEGLIVITALKIAIVGIIGSILCEFMKGGKRDGRKSKRLD